jgi:hypothetical protein
VAALVFLVFAVFDLTHAGMKLIGLPDPSRYPLSADLFASGVYLVIAILGFTTAGWFVRLCYGRGEG